MNILCVFGRSEIRYYLLIRIAEERLPSQLVYVQMYHCTSKALTKISLYVNVIGTYLKCFRFKFYVFNDIKNKMCICVT